MPAILSGWKTYLAGAGMMLVAVAKLAGAEIPGFEMIDPGTLFMNGLGFVGLRWKLG